MLHSSRQLTCLLFAFLMLSLLSCSSTESQIADKFNTAIGSQGIEKQIEKGDILYTWQNVSTDKDGELKAIVDKIAKNTPSETQPIAPYYGTDGNIIAGKFLKYWVYENEKIGIELNYIITGKTMTVEVRISNKNRN